MSKVTLVGAGSILWAPKILGDFYCVDRTPIREICLMDINYQALEPIEALSRLMEKQTGRGFRITLNGNLESAVQDAEYVVVSIAVGGLNAMEKDLQVPEKFGILPTVGDTVGASGYSRLMRNVPVFVDLAETVERIAPEAWLINVANPLTPLTRLISQTTSLKTVGLCSGILNHLWILKDLLDFHELSDVNFSVGGIDHCSWFLNLEVRGQDLYPVLRNLSVDELDQRASFSYSKDEWADLDSLTAGFTLFKRLGYLPAISDRHLGEFFPFFINDESNIARYQIKRTSIAHRRGWGEKAHYNLQSVLKGEKPLELRKSREIVVDVINGLAGTGAIRTTVNFPNEGQIENLPPGSVVEACATVDRDRIRPEKVGPLPAQLLAVVHPHITRQELAIQAALEGSRDLLISVLTSDPTIGELAHVERIATDLLEANKPLLARFFTDSPMQKE